MNPQLKTSALALCIATALSACGGGGGGGTAATTTSAAKPAVTVSGSVSGYGSVVINGVHYETTSSRIASDDDNSTIAENPTDDQLQNLIALGEVIRVRGGRDATGGEATTIFVDDELKGPVGSIDDASLTFRVMGQTVNVSSDTIIDDSLLADSAVDAALGTRTLTSILNAGDFVEISGHPGANGVEATRIETTLAGEGEVKGTVAALNANGTSFKINDLTVDISGLSVSVANGNFVEVKGAFDSATTTLTATTLELEDGQLEEGEVEVEGVIQAITPGQGTGGTIKIAGYEFAVADISQYSVGMKIEVKAQNQNGTLTVSRIQDETEDSIRIRDQAEGTKDATSFKTRLGLNLAISDRSRLELNDTADPDTATFLAGIQAGTYIEARGFPLNGSIVWTRIEASDDNKARCRLRGPVGASPAAPSFTISGVTITTNGNTVFRSANGTLIADSATFFSQLAAGDNVQATSASDGTGCTDLNLNPAKEVSFAPAGDVLENNQAGGDDGAGGNDDNGIDNELSGAISEISGSGSGTFKIGTTTVSFDGNSIIDDSIIEAVDGGDPVDQSLTNSGKSLSAWLDNDGFDTYTVTVDRGNGSGNPVATVIENF